MASLTFTLGAPLQSWGTTFNACEPPAGDGPSRSGVTGLLANALGRRRDADMADLNALDMHVTVTRAPVDGEDYHTIRRRNTIVRRDQLLMDARYQITLTGDRKLLEQVLAALREPARALYAGRRAYVLDRPPVTPDTRVEGD